MKLKLAQYNLETGKFERFLELGKDFIYGGSFVQVWFEPKIREGYVMEISSEELVEEGTVQHFEKDEKDPLNRFGGLFDEISYGNGRFILIINDDPAIMDKVTNS
jgi:hypothetical protein